MMKDKLKRALEGQQTETDHENSPGKKPRILLNIKIGAPDLEIDDIDSDRKLRERPRLSNIEVDGISDQRSGLAPKAAQSRERPKKLHRKIGASDPLLKSGSSHHLKCALCGQKEAKRSDLYGHYSSCHFKNQLVERLGAEKKECKEHKVTFQNQLGMVVHFGRVHNMVEDFLSPEHHTPLTSRGLQTTHGLKKKKSKVIETKRSTEENSTDGLRPPLKCTICDWKERTRSGLYGHYSRCHFKEQLLQRLGPDKKRCEECQQNLDPSNVVAHFGRVHNMVEEFLSPEHHIPLTTQGAKLKGRSLENHDIEEKETEHDRENGAKTAQETGKCDTDCKEATGLVSSSQGGYPRPPSTSGREAKRSCIRVGPKKKEKAPFLEDIVCHENTLLKKAKRPKDRKCKKNLRRCSTPPPAFASMLAHMVTLPTEINMETSMMSHQIVHPLPSQCFVCGEQFSSVRRAIIHEVEICQSVARRHHPCFGLKLFQCCHCETNFVLKRKFELHMKRHKAELGHGEIIFLNQTSHSNEALEISHTGETVKEWKTEDDSSTEDEDFSEEAKELYESKLRASIGDPATSQDGGESQNQEYNELYEPSTEDGDFSIDIKDDLKDFRVMFDDSSDDE